MESAIPEALNTSVLWGGHLARHVFGGQDAHQEQTVKLHAHLPILSALVCWASPSLSLELLYHESDPKLL